MTHIARSGPAPPKDFESGLGTRKTVYHRYGQERKREKASNLDKISSREIEREEELSTYSGKSEKSEVREVVAVFCAG